MSDLETTSGVSEFESSTEAYLIVLDGPTRVNPVRIGRRAGIGRSSRCELTLSSQLVSRTHAEVIRTESGFVLRDLGSVNGTFNNGQQIRAEEVSHGDRIEIGDFILRMHVGALDDPDVTDSDVVMYQTHEDTESRIAMRGNSGALKMSMMSKDAARAEQASVRLETLVNVTQRLARLHELEVLYPLVVDEVMRVLPAERVVLFRAEEKGQLKARAARNASSPGAQVEVSQTILEEVCSRRVCVLSADATLDDDFDISDSIVLHNIRSVLAVPIEYDADLLGALYLDAPGQENKFSEEDLHFVSGLAGIAAVAINNATALEQVQKTGRALNHTYLAMLAVLANAIEARDHYTVGHTWRVARFAQVVARRLGWPEEKLSEIEVGGLLHDIGKIGVKDSILSKTGPLSTEEKDLMKLHPQIGARMLHDVPTLRSVLPYVLHHHENYDGSGYPEQLVGTDIPDEARLLAVVDALDAMTSTRPYRQGLDTDVAMGRLERAAGTQFDPQVVEALVAAWKAGELDQYLVAGLHDPHDVICPHCSTYMTPPAEAVESGSGTCPTCNRNLRFWSQGDEIFADLA